MRDGTCIDPGQRSTSRGPLSPKSLPESNEAQRANQRHIEIHLTVSPASDGNRTLAGMFAAVVRELSEAYRVSLQLPLQNV